MSAARSLRTLCCIFLLGLAGCASNDGVDVSIAVDPLTQFPRNATYVWDEIANSLPNDDRIRQLDIDPLLRAAAREEFGKRGYREVEAPPANYRLSYELRVNTWLSGHNSRSVGTLSLSLVDASANRRVWMGFGRAEVHAGLSPPERQERLRRAIARMLEKFPPTQRGDG